MTKQFRIVMAVWLGWIHAGAVRADDFHLQLEALTDVPVQVGVEVTVEMPWRLRASTSLGVLPGAYVDLINEVVVAAGGYDQDTAALVRGSLQNSLVWRLHAGWRPFEGHGWYFEAGYALVALGGGLSAEEVVSLATGADPPDAEPARERRYKVSSTLHMIDVEVGWEWVLWERLALRAAVGFAGTLAAATDIRPDYRPVAPRLVDAFTGESEAYLDGIYTGYVFTPVVSLAAGYRFF